MNASSPSLAIILSKDVGPASAARMRSLEGQAQFYAVTTAEDTPTDYPQASGLERLKVVHLPVDQVASDFFHLVLVHRCVAATEFLLCYLVMHLCEALPEREIWIRLDMELNQATWVTAARVAKHYGKLLIMPDGNTADSATEYAQLTADVISELKKQR
jgi:hypothetical protein